MLVSLSLVSGMNEDISANCFVVYNIVVNPTALAKAAHRGRELGRENDMSWWVGGGGGGGHFQEAASSRDFFLKLPLRALTIFSLWQDVQCRKTEGGKSNGGVLIWGRL